MFENFRPGDRKLKIFRGFITNAQNPPEDLGNFHIKKLAILKIVKFKDYKTSIFSRPGPAHGFFDNSDRPDGYP